jgi:ribose 5-phosphate isomerase B
MKIAIAADHAGFALKERLRETLTEQGHQVVDYGTTSSESVDYPDYASLVAHDVAGRDADRGILVCHTGMGMCMAANKVHGIRAAVAIKPDQVRLARAHNDANVLTLGAALMDEAAASGMVEAFLNTAFEGGRHARRVDKIMALESETPSGQQGAK